MEGLGQGTEASSRLLPLAATVSQTPPRQSLKLSVSSKCTGFPGTDATTGQKHRRAGLRCVSRSLSLRFFATSRLFQKCIFEKFPVRA